MSIKENINMVKEELNSEEKFFEKAVMTERFVKKYKNVMIGSLVAVVVVVGANIAYEADKSKSVEAANKALVTLQKDASNTQALEDLKANSKNLYDVWMFAEAIAQKDTEKLKSLSSSGAPIVADIAAYEMAKTSGELDAYASKQGAIYRDLALVQSAVLLLNENKAEKAQQKLKMISLESPFSQVASALLHYGVK